MGYMRHLERQARRINGEKQPKVLEPFNDRQETGEAYLHPTKGWRHVSERRSRIALLTHEMRNATVPFSMTIMQSITKDKKLGR